MIAETPETAAADAVEAESAPADSAVKIDWPYDVLETLSGDSFYLDVARAGIEYGDKFRMVLKRQIDGHTAVLRFCIVSINFVYTCVATHR